MNSDIKILIADDHPVFRRGLRNIIESDSSLKIVVEVEDGAEAIERLREFQPDVAILDVDMPKMGGFDVVRELKKLDLNTQIIFLTMYRDEGLFNQAIDLGVKGYVLKDSAISDIISAVRASARGENFISPTLATFLVKRANRFVKFAEHKPSIQNLTPAERNVLKLIAEHKTSREIADLLFISTRTVERHRLNICTKLEIHGSNALLKFALENKKLFL